MISSILFFVVWCIMVACVYVQARDQGRNIILWVAVALVVTPVIPAAILYVLPRLKK